MEEDMNLNKEEEEEEVDRINNLPDPLIHHILSFLKIKHVAQTSVLSKKWSYIWITNPILDFQDPVCFEPTDLKINEFMNFIDGTLQRRYSGATIQRFTITWYKHLNVNRVNSWITWAVRHNVQQFSLYLIQKEPLIITRSLFTCESLISLKLQITPDIRLPNYISFPKLKSLEIEGVEFSKEYLNEKLFFNCPLLEDFRMEHCTWFGMPNFCISTPSLKHLNIDNWDDRWLPRGEDDGLQGCTLKVHAPNLETLYYSGSIAKEYVLTTFPILVRAAVQFRFKPYVTTRKQRISHGAAISQFLRALANIKHLCVSDDTLQALSFADNLLQKLPTFHNTKELIMLEEVTAHKALVALLKATPNLKLLTFNKTMLSDYEEEDDADAADGENNHGSEDDVAGSDADAVEGEDNHDWTHDMVTDPDCLFPHLKSVYFKEFIGNLMEMEWVKLILKNAKALRTISISNDDHFYLLNTKRKEELMVEIPSLPRASATCVVKFPTWQLKMPKNPNLLPIPKLKSLEIEGVEFSNWNENLFSNCPLLEDFRLEHCIWFGMPNFCISAPALRHFKISNWNGKWLPRGEDDGLRGCTLKLHAPNLETLNYNGSIAKEYVLTIFPLLVRAVVQFRFKPYVATRKQRISHGAVISQLIGALANVKRLFVSDDTLQNRLSPSETIY